jgi:hypothetical protein
MPQSTAPPSRAQKLLLDFLRDYDAACPLCGYNLKSLTRPFCPECRQELTLAVGVLRLRMRWLFFAVAPGFFSGIAACFVSIPTTAIYFEDGVIVWPLVGAVLFGWCSCAFAIMLATRRHRFLAQPPNRQRWSALLIWLIHFTTLVLLIVAMAPLI